MVGWLEDGLNSGGESVGLGLEHGAAAAFDFVGPVGQTTEEGVHLLMDLGLGPEAGVGGDFGTNPTPDMLIGSNRMHLLWFASHNVIDAVAPRAGASR